MIADLVVTVLVRRGGGVFSAECPEFELSATGGSAEDAREELLRLVRRRVEELGAAGELEAFLARAGFVVDNGVLRTERRLVSAEEAVVPVPL